MAACTRSRDVSLSVGDGTVRRHRRAERRRQDDAVQGHLRDRDAACPGAFCTRARICSRCLRRSAPHLGIAHVPEGRQVFASMTVLENLEMGAYLPAGRAAWRRSLERIFTLFPVLADRRSSSRVRCRAASSRWWRSAAGSPPRPSCCLLDEPSMGLAPGRGGHDLRVHRGDPSRGRRHHPAGRAASGGGAARPATWVTSWRRAGWCCRARAMCCWPTTGSGRRI